MNKLISFVFIGCTDSETWCAGSEQFCQINNYIRNACKATCGECSSSSTGCTDSETWCAGSKQFCKLNIAIRDRCKATCGECSSSSTDVEVGKWSKWGKYSACTKACGGGTKVRYRTCSVPGTCRGPRKSTMQCRKQACPDLKAGKWRKWGKYSKCSKTCGGGTKTRSRTCFVPGSCKGPSKSTIRCQMQACTDCTDSETWCTGSKQWCQVNNYIRNRCKATCGECSSSSTGAKWGPWTSWGTCSLSCGGGQEKRTRSCQGPGECTGEASQTRVCNQAPCTNPAKWGPWTSWGTCSLPCGGGQEKRTRSCQGPGECTGEASQTRVCNQAPCTNQWLPWEKWGGCSKACGIGEQKRLRVCINTAGCSGKAEDTKSCNLRSCTTEYAFSPCSRTCGYGIKTKLQSNGEYLTEACKLKDCIIKSCGYNEEKRYKNLYSCCKKTSATAFPVCNRPAGKPIIRRIIGGTATKTGEFPWMIFLENTYGVKCGGSIISSKFILSAAHCLQSNSGLTYPVSSYTLKIGYTNLANWNNVSPALEASLPHPDYSFPYHDIGLLKLKHNLAFTNYIRPICLPHGEETPYDTTCIAMGYGITTTSSTTISNILQNVDLPVLDPNVCVQGYGTSSVFSHLLPFLKERKGYICAGDLAGNKDSCSGDSGSPLACQRCDNCGWYVSSVVSYGPNPCAAVGIPAVYTKVTEYEQWIYHVTGINKESWTCSS